MVTTAPSDTDRLLKDLRRMILGLVRQEAYDLTARQLAVFLICYHKTQPQTVRGLAATLNISKQVIARALDRLEEEGLLRREANPLDGRSVIAARTPVGDAFLRDLRWRKPAP